MEMSVQAPKRVISGNAMKLAQAMKESTGYIYNDKRDIYLNMMKMGYPILTSYTSSVLTRLEDIFGDKKKVMKYITAASKLKDAGEFEIQLKSESLRHLITHIGYDRTIKLYRKISDKGVSFHDLVSNLPTVNVENDAEEMFKFIMKILDFNLDNAYEVFPYMNYKKVRQAKNMDEMKKHITFIELRKGGYKNDRVFKSNLVLQNHITNTTQIGFSKDPKVIYIIGRETNCCFKKGGAAEALLKPALESPIAGILHGYMGARWFSFTWELVEFNTATGLIEKNLVLDNIEAKRILSQSEFEHLLSECKKWGYNRVYCGYCRNDIPTLPESISSTIKVKPYHLSNYEAEFKKYGSYDDSAKIYTFFEEDVDNLSHTAQVRRMNDADHHRAAYIEKLLWGKHTDKDFIKIDISKSPSYVIDNDTNIFSYLVTELQYYSVNDDGQPKHIKGKELRDWRLDNMEDDKPEYEGLTPVLYLSDIFAYKNRHVLSGLNNIFEDLSKWCKENGITKISANPNGNSKPFIKRISKLNPEIEYFNEPGISAFEPVSFFMEKFNNKQITNLEIKL